MQSPGFSSGILRLAACGAALTLCACGVHQPSEHETRVSSTGSSGDAGVALLGGPDRTGQAAAARADGFELLGGPPSRSPKAARVADSSVGGFEMAATDPSVARPTAWTSGASAASAPAAVLAGGPDPAVVAAAAADPASGPPSVRAAGALVRVSDEHVLLDVPAQLNAFALWQVPAGPSDLSAGADNPKLGEQAPIRGGQIAMFLACVAAAGGVWTWHRRSQRMAAQPESRKAA
jgi:hypothetical protein